MIMSSLPAVSHQGHSLQLPVAIDRPGQHYQGWLDGGHAGFSHRYRQAAEQQLAYGKQLLLPLVQRLYLLDNSQTLQQQWQEGACRLF